MLCDGHYPALVVSAKRSNLCAGPCQRFLPCTFRHTVLDRSQVVDNPTHPQVDFDRFERKGQDRHDPSCGRRPCFVQENDILNLASTSSKRQSSTSAKPCTSTEEEFDPCACCTETCCWVDKECDFACLAQTDENEGRSDCCEAAPCSQESYHHDGQDRSARCHCSCSNCCTGHAKGGRAKRLILFSSCEGAVLTSSFVGGTAVPAIVTQLGRLSIAQLRTDLSQAAPSVPFDGFDRLLSLLRE